jgi:hypothetical protein
VECFIHSINWSSKSLDLNLIENIWRVIKQKLRNRKPHGGEFGKFALGCVGNLRPRN